MRRSLKRMLWAAAFSATSLGSVLAWYFATAPKKIDNSNRKAIAYIQNVRDEIHRRPAKRQIWQSINNGEPVFSGEAIRTSQMGEVRIQFAEGERFIDMEPESIVMISQNSQQELSLDLMEGGAQITASENSEGPALTLNQGGKKIDIKGSALLSKSVSGKLDLQLLDQEPGVNSLFNSPLDSKLNSFQILSPEQDGSLFVDSENPESTLFRWKNLPPGSVARVMVGQSRKAFDKNTESTSDHANLLLVAGKYFWKMTVTDIGTKKLLGESKVFRLKVLARQLPQLLFPAPDKALESEDKTMDLTFRWTKPEVVKNVVLELSTDPGLKNKILTKYFSSEVQMPQTLALGDYYVRLSAQYQGEDKLKPGPVQRFSILEKEFKMGVVHWNLPDSSEVQFYVKDPVLSLGWVSDARAKIRSWRLKLADSSENLVSATAKTLDAKELQYKEVMQKPGRYIAMVEGLDVHQRVIATSDPKALEVKPLPLLAAPAVSPAGELLADNEGRLSVSWLAVGGAVRYKLRLVDGKGKEVRAEQTLKTTVTLEDLMPGEYQIQLAALDSYGRYGEREVRRLQVPGMSNVAAPKLKKMKVK